MPNGNSPKKYGEHEYAETGTSDCKYNCGCWMGGSRSGGPTGLDPFGTCPNNPEDGNLLGGKLDYDYVVTKRIDDLIARVQNAEGQLKRVSPKKKALADELFATKNKLEKKNALITELRNLIGTGP